MSTCKAGACRWTSAVPEVETWVAAALAGAFGAFWLNRQIWGESRPANTRYRNEDDSPWADWPH